MKISIPRPTAAGSWWDTVAKAIEQLLHRLTAAAIHDVADTPDPAPNKGKWIFVPDEAGGAVMAFSDGTDWRRCTDRAVIS